MAFNLNNLTTVPVSKPESLSIYPGITSMSAVWKRTTGVSGYDVTIASYNSNLHQTFTVQDNKIYIKSGLKPSTEYSFRLVAKRGTTSSPAVITSFTTMPALQAPPELEAELKAELKAEEEIPKKAEERPEEHSEEHPEDHPEKSQRWLVIATIALGALLTLLIPIIIALYYYTRAPDGGRGGSSGGRSVGSHFM